MKLTIVMTIIILLYTMNANAEYKFAENWNKTDTAWQMGFTTLCIADWLQTRYISTHPNDYRETNKVLGEHPSLNEVDSYFVSVLAAHAIVAAALPPEAEVFDYKINPRRIWQGVWIGVEGGYVIHNISIGIKFEY